MSKFFVNTRSDAVNRNNNYILTLSKPLHKVYQQNDRLIQREIFKAVANRSMSVRISQVCHNAKLSLPTFYAHYRSCNDVLDQYERNLLCEFRESLPITRTRTVVFSLLLILIYKHRKYFKANLTSHNFYILSLIIDELRPILASKDISDKVYLNYTATVISSIVWWGTREKFAKGLIPIYARQLARTRFISL